MLIVCSAFGSSLPRAGVALNYATFVKLKSRGRSSLLFRIDNTMSRRSLQGTSPNSKVWRLILI